MTKNDVEIDLCGGNKCEEKQCFQLEGENCKQGCLELIPFCDECTTKLEETPLKDKSGLHIECSQCADGYESKENECVFIEHETIPEPEPEPIVLSPFD